MLVSNKRKFIFARVRRAGLFAGNFARYCVAGKARVHYSAGNYNPRIYAASAELIGARRATIARDSLIATTRSLSPVLNLPIDACLYLE